MQFSNCKEPIHNVTNVIQQQKSILEKKSLIISLHNTKLLKRKIF